MIPSTTEIFGKSLCFRYMYMYLKNDQGNKTQHYEFKLKHKKTKQKRCKLTTKDAQPRNKENANLLCSFCLFSVFLSVL